MSGHSKFANIKHKKERNDAAKGKIFTVIGRELVMAVKAGGPDPNNNSKLRDVIAKAKANNMPNDTIERGIKKAAGADSGADRRNCRCADLFLPHTAEKEGISSLARGTFIGAFGRGRQYY